MKCRFDILHTILVFNEVKSVQSVCFLTDIKAAEEISIVREYYLLLLALSFCLHIWTLYYVHPCSIEILGQGILVEQNIPPSTHRCTEKPYVLAPAVIFEILKLIYCPSFLYPMLCSSFSLFSSWTILFSASPKWESKAFDLYPQFSHLQIVPLQGFFTIHSAFR